MSNKKFMFTPNINNTADDRPANAHAGDRQAHAAGANPAHTANRPPHDSGSPPYAGITPLDFVRDVLGDSPYSKQEEILRAIYDASIDTKRRRVSVVGCNSSGKDWTAARAVLWWMLSRERPKVIVTGPTTRQVKDIIWDEVRHAHANSKTPLPGKVRRSAIFELDDGSFAKGIASNSAHNLQGYHSPNLLVVITEAHAFKNAYFDSMLRLNPKVMLMTGNPFAEPCEFFDSHHSKRHRYRTIQISALDTPNITEQRLVIPGMITQEDLDDRKEDWGEDSTRYLNSVLGEFTEDLDSIVVPLAIAREAAARNIEPEGEVIVSCDIARKGKSKTVIAQRQGGHTQIIARQRGNDLMQITGLIKRHCETNRVDTLIVDDVGIGAGVFDRLREQNLPVGRLLPFNGGDKPKDRQHFSNRASEAWWAMRERYVDGSISTPADDALISQVSSREYTIKSNGRIQLQPKSQLPESPDEADALAMTFAQEPVYHSAPQTYSAFAIWV